MNDMNQVVMAGRLTEDAVLRQSGNGASFVTFRLANNRYKKNDRGEADKEAAFFNVVYFPQKDETPDRLLKKGQAVHLEGRLAWRTYTTKEGSRRDEVKIISNVLKIMEKSELVEKAG